MKRREVGIKVLPLCTGFSYHASDERKTPTVKVGVFLSWERVDSNHRSNRSRFTVCPLWPLGNAPIQEYEIFVRALPNVVG